MQKLTSWNEIYRITKSQYKNAFWNSDVSTLHSLCCCCMLPPLTMMIMRNWQCDVSDRSMSVDIIAITTVTCKAQSFLLAGGHLMQIPIQVRVGFRCCICYSCKVKPCTVHSEALVL